MVYMATDNDLEERALKSLKEMKRVGSNESLNIVVQVDLKTVNLSGGENTTENAFRGRVEKSVYPFWSDLPPIPEPNMGAPETLRDFLTWAMTTYPAENFALVIKSHGLGWETSGLDESSDDGRGRPNDDHISMAELREGLALAQGKRLNVLAFEACQMGQLEVANQVILSAEILVASQDCNISFPYEHILYDLKKNATWDGEALATHVVDDYHEWAADTYVMGHGYLKNWTMSAIRLDFSLFNSIYGSANALGYVLGKAVEDYRGHENPNDNLQLAIKRARDNASETSKLCCQAFPAVSDTPIDLLHFVKNVAAEGIDPLDDPTSFDPQAFAHAFEGVFQQIVIANKTGPGYDGHLANGLSIYFPQHENGFIPYKSTREDNIAIVPFDRGSMLLGHIYHVNPQEDHFDGMPVPLDHPKPEPDIGFSAPRDWAEFLFRYYRPVADAGEDQIRPWNAMVDLDASGSTDADGTIVNYSWDLNLGVDTDPGDADKTGPRLFDTATLDDTQLEGVRASFRCLQDVYEIRLIVRDDHETAHPDHFNVDDDYVTVTCIEDPENVLPEDPGEDPGNRTLGGFVIDEYPPLLVSAATAGPALLVIGLVALAAARVRSRKGRGG